MTFKTFLKLKLVFLVFLALGTSGAAYAADTVGLIDSQKVMFQHPGFDEASKILILFRRPLEGNAPQILTGERDPARREMIMKYSAQVTEFARMDRAISNEKDPAKKNGLGQERQKKLSEFEAGLMGPIIEDCGQAIRTVMDLKKMTVVIELNAVYYG
ncbi:MAG: hypothetical protein FWG71_06275, partial [Synergistaceae bacterium]|nr:hypothetical protein [Synergistaceae bacterium]